MKKIVDSIKWLFSFFNDESGLASSKRLVGVGCGVSLCVAMFLGVDANDHIVDAVALLAFGCLGLSSIDRYTSMKKALKEATSLNGSSQQAQDTSAAAPASPEAAACTCPPGCACGNCEKCIG